MNFIAMNAHTYRTSPKWLDFDSLLFLLLNFEILGQILWTRCGYARRRLRHVMVVSVMRWCVLVAEVNGPRVNGVVQGIQEAVFCIRGVRSGRGMRMCF